MFGFLYGVLTNGCGPVPAALEPEKFFDQSLERTLPSPALKLNMCFAIYYRALLILALVCSVSESIAPRTGWIFNQLESSPFPTSFGETRNQFSLHGENLSDAFSVLSSLFVDLRHAEIGVKAAKRFFLGSSEFASSLEKQLATEESMIAAELARNHVTMQNNFGRIVLAFLHFRPSGYQWVKLGLSTGMLSTSVKPWGLMLSGSFYKSLNHLDPRIVISLRVMRSNYFSGGSNFDLGGQLLWAYRIKPAFLDPGIYEHMLFSLGPVTEYQMNEHRLRMALFWRLDVDKQVLRRADGVYNIYPNELSLFPDVSLNYSVVF